MPVLSRPVRPWCSVILACITCIVGCSRPASQRAAVASDSIIPAGPYGDAVNQDPNQLYSIPDQLQMDVRAVEFDVHNFPTVTGDVVLCHGDTRVIGPLRRDLPARGRGFAAASAR